MKWLSYWLLLVMVNYSFALIMPSTSGRYAGPSPLVPREEECSKQNSVISAAASGSAVVVWTAGTGMMSLSACQWLLRHGIGRIMDGDCTDIATFISGAVMVTYATILTLKPGAKNNFGAVDAVPEPGKRRRSGNRQGSGEPPRLADLVALELSGRGKEFETVEDLLITSPWKGKRALNGTQRVLLDHFRINGLTHRGVKQDVTIANYGNGEGHVFVQPSHNHTTGDLAKRHNGPGFKLTYSADQASHATHADQQKIADDIAENWAAKANIDGMDTYMGYTVSYPFYYYTDFYFRIIAETGGYGDNFESTDFCGGMRWSATAYSGKLNPHH